jgi:hypothetical protein
MGVKTFAVIAAACAAAGAAAPSAAQDLRAPMTTFFMEVPLDARSPKEQAPNFGLQFQGSRPYQALRVDQKMFRLLPAIAGVEATWIIAGAVGVAAVASIAHKDKGTEQQLNQDKQLQQQQMQQQGQPSSGPCACVP